MAKTAKLNDRRQEKAAAKPEVDKSHNGGVTQELLLSHLADLNRLKSQEEKAKTAYKKARKKAKSDGIVLMDLDYAVSQAEKLPEEVIAAHNTRIQYMDWMGIPTAKMLTKVEPTDERHLELTDEERAENAKQDGYVAGREGKDQKQNPHDLNTPAGQGWMEGWHQGQKELVPGMQEAAQHPPRSRTP